MTAIAATCLGLLTACNTVEGAGKAISKTAKDVAN
jgi:predicted small secreted protein